MQAELEFMMCARRVLLAAGAISMAACGSAWAQTNPGKEVRVIVFPGNIASLPIWIADKFRYFEAEKL